MKRIFLAVGLLYASLGLVGAADAPVPWTDVNVPVAGHRYVYRGNMFFPDPTTSVPNIELTLTYANVQTTADGMRYDLTEKIINLPDGSTVYDATETRELRAATEVLLRRVDRGPWFYLRRDTLKDVTYTQGNLVPRTFEIGRTYVYDHLITGTASVVESRSVLVEKYETISTAAGTFRTLKVGATGLVVGDRSFYLVWSAKNVGPVKIRRNVGPYTCDVTLVSANFPLEAGVFDEPGPKITGEPESLAVAAGTTARFQVIATGDGLSYTWNRDGAVLAGATTATLTLPATTQALGGRYQVAVTGGGRTVQSKPAFLTVTELGDGTGKLANLSVRANAPDGSGQLIVGMVMQGAATPHRVLMRAAGPWLRQFFVPDYARDPALSVRDARGALLVENDNWGQFSDQPGLRAIIPAVGAFPFAADSADAALIARLGTGNYTAQASDQAGGITVLECYDADLDLPGSFGNLSVRSEIRGDPLIAGIIVSGTSPVRLLVRGVGPTLARFGVPASYPNPRLRIVRDGEIAMNEDWSTSTQKEELRAAFATVGAFALDENSADAAVIAVLPPGVYSAIIDASPIPATALIEVYRLPN